MKLQVFGAVLVAFLEISTSIIVKQLENCRIADGCMAQSVPSWSIRYMVTGKSSKQLAFFQSSLCLVRHNLVPRMTAKGFSYPEIIVYVDNSTSDQVSKLLCKLGHFCASPTLINLDLDQELANDVNIFKPFAQDVTNIASIRRLLADAKYLNNGRPRLLLGTDVSVLRPDAFVAEASELPPDGALYMSDTYTFSNQFYTITNYTGPQCPGLLGDFVYLGPAVHLVSDVVKDKLRFYGSKPPNAQKVQPPCGPCALNGGYHAIDQFALNLAVGEATKAKCKTLDVQKYIHWTGKMKFAEAVHDKLVLNRGGVCNCSA